MPCKKITIDNFFFSLTYCAKNKMKKKNEPEKYKMQFLNKPMSLTNHMFQNYNMDNYIIYIIQYLK